MKKWLFIFLIIPSLVFASLQVPVEYEMGKLVDVQPNSRDIYFGSTYFMVQLKDMIYQGEYVRRSRLQYKFKPDDFVVNDPIEVRIIKKNMFIKRPNGREIKTKIVRKERLK